MPGSGAPTLVIDRSAEAVTVVDAVAVLLAGLGSAVAALTEAVLVIMPPSSAGVATIVVVGGVPPGAARLARVQVTLALVPLHVQPVPEALWKVKLGRASCGAIALVAVEGPALLTVRV